MDKHLKVYDLMEKQQRGAKTGCSGTTDNLQIDRTVTLDCHRHKRNLSVAWVDVRKAYDSEVIYEMFHILNCGFEIKETMIIAVLNAI